MLNWIPMMVKEAKRIIHVRLANHGTEKCIELIRDIEK